jgi:hypothetical protein
LPFYM